MKRTIALILLVVMLLSFASCKSLDYSKASKELDSGNYNDAIKIFDALGDYKDSTEKLSAAIYSKASNELDKGYYNDAIEMFYELGDYKDSKEKLSVAIDKQIEYLDEYREYSDELDLYKKYDTVIDYSEEINLLSKYQEAINAMCPDGEFRKDGVEHAIAILKQLPSDYKNTKQLIQTYYQIVDNKYIGTYSFGTGSGIYFVLSKISIDLDLSYKYDRFQLRVHRSTHFNDGSIASQSSYNFDVSEVNNDTLSGGNYTWTLDEEGNIVELERTSSRTCRNYYHKR